MITIMITLGLIFLLLVSVMIKSSIEYNNKLKNRKDEINRYKVKHIV